MNRAWATKTKAEYGMIHNVREFYKSRVSKVVEMGDSSILEARIRQRFEGLENFVNGSGRALESLAKFEAIMGQDETDFLPEPDKEGLFTEHVPVDSTSAAKVAVRQKHHHQDIDAMLRKTRLGSTSKYKKTSKFSISLPLVDYGGSAPPDDSRVLTPDMKKAMETTFLVQYLQHLDVLPSPANIDNLRRRLVSSKKAELTFKFWWRDRGSNQNSVQIHCHRQSASAPTSARADSASSPAFPEGHGRRNSSEPKAAKPKSILTSLASAATAGRASKRFSATLTASVTSRKKGLRRLNSKRNWKRVSKLGRTLSMKKKLYNSYRLPAKADRAFALLTADLSKCFRHFVSANLFCRKQQLSEMVKTAEDRAKSALEVSHNLYYLFSKHRHRKPVEHGNSTIVETAASDDNQPALKTAAADQQQTEPITNTANFDEDDDAEKESRLRKAAEEELLKPIHTPIEMVQALLTKFVELFPLHLYRSLYSEDDVLALRVLLQHAATTQLVSLLCHLVYWRIFGDRIEENQQQRMQDEATATSAASGEPPEGAEESVQDTADEGSLGLSQRRLEHVYTQISITWRVLIDAAVFQTQRSLFHIPLLLDSIYTTVRSVFAFQYPLTFPLEQLQQQNRHEEDKYAGIVCAYDTVDHLLDEVLQPNTAFISDFPLTSVALSAKSPRLNHAPNSVVAGASQSSSQDQQPHTNTPRLNQLYHATSTSLKTMLTDPVSQRTRVILQEHLSTSRPGTVGNTGDDREQDGKPHATLPLWRERVSTETVGKLFKVAAEGHYQSSAVRIRRARRAKTERIREPNSFRRSKRRWEYWQKEISPRTMRLPTMQSMPFGSALSVLGSVIDEEGPPHIPEPPSPSRYTKPATHRRQRSNTMPIIGI